MKAPMKWKGLRHPNFKISNVDIKGPKNPPRAKEPIVKPIRLPLREGITSPTKEYRAAMKIPAPIPVIKKSNMSVQ